MPAKMITKLHEIGENLVTILSSLLMMTGPGLIG